VGLFKNREDWEKNGAAAAGDRWVIALQRRRGQYSNEDLLNDEFEVTYR
jgi:hypothetical protein